MRSSSALTLVAALLVAALTGCGNDDDRPATTVAEFFVLPEMVPTFERRLDAQPGLFAGGERRVEQCGRIGDRVACLVRVDPPATEGGTACVFEFAGADRPRPRVVLHEVDDAAEGAGAEGATPEEQCERRTRALRRAIAGLPDGL